MKTYKKTTEVNKLVISHDEDCTSPRGDCNLGYFITVDRSYHSPDSQGTLESIVRDTGNIASGVRDHSQKIKKEVEEQLQEKVLEIFPVTKYEHGAVTYSLGLSQGFDCSHNGFYIITDRTQKEVGTLKEDWERVIGYELESYNKYVNGDMYGFTLFDDDGEVVDSCGGFYEIDDIKEALGEEWKDENMEDYFKY